MIGLLFLLTLFTVLTAVAYPAFARFDRRLARRRVQFGHDQHARAAQRDVGSVDDNNVESTRSRTPTFHDSSVCLDQIARRLRLGQSPTVALIDSLRSSHAFLGQFRDVLNEIQHTGDVRATFAPFLVHECAVTRRFAIAVWIAYSHHGVHPAALDRAARSHRDRAAAQHELRTATSASRYSTLVLSILPVASLFLSPLWGTNLLPLLISSPALAACIIAGLGLNTAGYVWAKRISTVGT